LNNQIIDQEPKECNNTISIERKAVYSSISGLEWNISFYYC